MRKEKTKNKNYIAEMYIYQSLQVSSPTVNTGHYELCVVSLVTGPTTLAPATFIHSTTSLTLTPH